MLLCENTTLSLDSFSKGNIVDCIYVASYPPKGFVRHIAKVKILHLWRDEVHNAPVWIVHDADRNVILVAQRTRSQGENVKLSTNIQDISGPPFSVSDETIEETLDKIYQILKPGKNRSS